MKQGRIQKVYAYLCRLGLLLALCVFMQTLASCSTPAGTDTQETPFMLYYVDNEKISLLSAAYTPLSDKTDTEGMIDEILAMLQANPTNLATSAPIMGNVILRDYTFRDAILTLNFDILYNMQDEVTEILNRAAVVRTLSQIEGVDNIIFLIDGTALLNHDGEAVGAMNAGSFIFNAVSELHSYDKVRIMLYFTSGEGDKLIPVYRTTLLNSNMSIERLVVEQLIMGPQTEGIYATIHPDTKVVNVSLQDGVCYVDLNEAFLNTAGNVSAEVTIYSIVNSLTELANVDRVQISVTGQTITPESGQGLFSVPLKRNADLIVTP